jgi:hypothetical protein
MNNNGRWIVPAIASVCGSLLVAGVVGMWVLNGQVATLITKIDGIVLLGTDHEARLRMLETARDGSR